MTTSASGPDRGIRYDIQGLRALSVIAILLFHLDLSWAAGGFIGVDIFMVISGFLITGSLLRLPGQGLFLQFWDRRIRRLMPALIAMLAISFGLAWITISSPDAFASYGWTSLYTLFYVANFKFAQATDYFAPGSAMNYLLHTWSLAVEEQFYFIMPFVVFLLRRTRRLALWFALATLASFALNVALFALEIGESYAFYMLPTRAWQFLLGGLVYMATSHAPRGRATTEAMAALGLALIAVSFLAFDASTPFPDWAALAPTLGCALALFSGIARPGVLHQALSIRPLRLLGDISYSFYLFHWPVIVYARHFYGKEELPLRAVPVVVLVIFALSWLCWRFVETPYRTSKIPARHWYLGFGTAAAAAVALCATPIATGGAPGRVPLLYQAEPTAEMKRFGKDHLACLATSRTLERLEDLCRIGDALREPTVAIWGDSHAGAIIHGLHHLRADLPFTAWQASVPGCVPALRVEDGAPTDCTARTKKLLAPVSASEATTTVVLAARWSNLLGLSEESGETPHSGEVALNDRAQDILALVEQLKAAGKRVILVSSVPEPRYHAIIAGWVQSRFGFSPDPTFARGPEQARLAGALAAIDAVGAAADVDVVRPFDILCDADRCTVVGEEGYLYRDDDHLSVLGAARLVPAIVARVTPDAR